MPVSSGLQQYFDKKRSKKQVQQKLDDIAGQIDPAFLASFEQFRTKVLDIVDDTPEAENVVSEEIDIMGEKMKDRKRKHNLKKSAVVADKILQ